MDFLHQILDLFLHFDKHLDYVCANYGLWAYGLLFLIIFCETGLVVTPFLPGDSLLFAVGALAARGSLDLWTSIGVLFAAAVLGNFVNYSIGARVGGGLFKENALVLKKAYLDRTHAFFDKHGGKAIILTRFLPIIRTVAPFAAGMGKMGYTKFTAYNVAGAALWVVSLTGAGWFFGNIPFVKKNFELVVIGIIAISLLPVFWEALMQFKASRQGKKHDSPAGS
jgi:membrane-associated protein